MHNINKRFNNKNNKNDTNDCIFTNNHADFKENNQSNNKTNHFNNSTVDKLKNNKNKNINENNNYLNSNNSYDGNIDKEKDREMMEIDNNNTKLNINDLQDSNYKLFKQAKSISNNLNCQTQTNNIHPQKDNLQENIKIKLNQMKSKMANQTFNNPNTEKKEDKTNNLPFRHRNRNENKSELIITKNESFLLMDSKRDTTPEHIPSNPNHKRTITQDYTASYKQVRQGPGRDTTPDMSNLELKKIRLDSNQSNYNNQNYFYTARERGEPEYNFGRDKSPNILRKDIGTKDTSRTPDRSAKGKCSSSNTNARKTPDHTPEKSFSVKDHLFMKKVTIKNLI